MRSLIMDLDGTLIDSVPDVCASLNSALASEDLAALHPDQVRQMIGHGARVLIEHVVSQSGRNEAVNIDALRVLFLAEFCARPVENTVIFSAC
jgi:phosphoglycolate phosphatase